MDKLGYIYKYTEELELFLDLYSYLCTLWYKFFKIKIQKIKIFGLGQNTH